MKTPAFLTQLRDWLMAGYPDGIPHKDYSPILALVGREHLSDEEINQIAEDLLAAGILVPASGEVPSAERIAEIVHDHLHEDPSPEEVARVAALLGEFVEHLPAEASEPDAAGDDDGAASAAEDGTGSR